jgi:hypothetical protein
MSKDLYPLIRRLLFRDDLSIHGSSRLLTELSGMNTMLDVASARKQIGKIRHEFLGKYGQQAT